MLTIRRLPTARWRQPGLINNGGERLQGHDIAVELHVAFILQREVDLSQLLVEMRAAVGGNIDHVDRGHGVVGGDKLPPCLAAGAGHRGYLVELGDAIAVFSHGWWGHRATPTGYSPSGYAIQMIKNPELFATQGERDRWDRLRRMTAADSIAIGEALLTSELMTLAEFFDDDRPQSLALMLGLSPTTEARKNEGRKG